MTYLVAIDHQDETNSCTNIKASIEVRREIAREEKTRSAHIRIGGIEKRQGQSTYEEVV